MRLIVGVVTINYFDEPTGVVRDFLVDLTARFDLGDADPEYEEEDDYDGDHYTWCNDGIVEFSRHYLNWKMDKWTDSEGIPVERKAEVQRWIADLPWKNDYVMLHLEA